MTEWAVAHSALGPDRRYTMRHATQGEQKVIRRLIRHARINPMSLRWNHFMVAVNERDVVIGTGQLKRHNDGTLELASLVVRASWRGAGVARTIVERLIDSTEEHLYLTCLSALAPLYRKFGFRQIGGQRIRSRYFRRMDRIVTVFHRLFNHARYPVIMERLQRDE